MYKLFSFWYTVVIAAKTDASTDHLNMLQIVDKFLKTQSTEELLALRDGAQTFADRITTELVERD